MIEPARDSRGFRLDPCALPADTRGRYQMLMVAAFLLVWGLPDLFMELPNFIRFQHRVDPAVTEKLEDFLERGLRDMEPKEVRAIYELGRQNPEYGENFRIRVLLVLSSIAGVAVLAGVTFWLLFAQGERLRRGSRFLAASEMPSLCRELGAMLQRLRLPRLPELRLRPGLLDGEAHGSRFRSLLIVGDLGVERTWSAFQRVTLLHELAHLTNGDGLPRELSRACWIAASLIAGPAMLLWPWLGHSGPPWWEVLLRLLVPFVIAALLWAGLVRDRELYADAQVASWGFGAQLERRLTLPSAVVSEAAPAPPRWAVVRIACRRWMGRHPTNDERREALRHPSLLFRLPIADLAASGLMVGLLAGNAGALVGLANIGAAIGTILLAFKMPLGLALCWNLIAVHGLMLLALAYFLAGSLGNQVLRMAVADGIDDGSSAPRLRELLAGSGAFTLALEMTLSIYFGPWTSWLGLQLGLAWLVATAGVFWIWLEQAYRIGRDVLGRWSGRILPSWLLPLLRFGLAVQLMFLTFPLLALRIYGVLGDHPELLADMTLPGKTAQASLDAASKLVVIAMIPALLARLAGSLGLVGGLRLWSRRRARCSRCHEPAARREESAGRCASCGMPLSAWLLRQDQELS